MGVPDKSMDIYRGLSAYLTVQGTFVCPTLSTSPLLTHLYPVMLPTVTPIQYRTQGFQCSLLGHTGATPLDSETWWTGELWSKTNILKWQK